LLGSDAKVTRTQATTMHQLGLEHIHTSDHRLQLCSYRYMRLLATDH
jgi:ribosomal protein L30/L7E